MGKDDPPCRCRFRCRVWENSLYYFKAARRAARAADTAGTVRLPLTLPPGCASMPVGWREDVCLTGPRLEPPGGHRGRGGFDKGTLAAAHIGLMRAGPEASPIRQPAYGPPLRGLPFIEARRARTATT